MNIRIRHQTRYDYDAPSAHSVQSLRLTPRAHAGQRIGRWTITGNGRRDLPEIEDAFGNIVHTLSVTEMHDGVSISVVGEVHTSDTGGVLKAFEETLPAAVYLRSTDLTEADDAIRDLAAPLVAVAASDGLDTAHQLMKAVHAAVAYRIGETDAATTASQALAAGVGVCQDHAHVMISAARVLDIPARYVSGYLADDGAGEVYEASHAWAELRIEGLGWVGFDAANAVCPTESYVRTSHGLDYHGAAPVIGMRRGGGPEDLTVSVEATPVMQQNQARAGTSSGEARA